MDVTVNLAILTERAYRGCLGGFPSWTYPVHSNFLTKRIIVVPLEPHLSKNTTNFDEPIQHFELYSNIL